MRGRTVLKVRRRWLRHALVVVVAVVAVVPGCASAPHGAAVDNPPTVVAAPASELCEGDEVAYPGQDGRTALEILLSLDVDARVNGTGDTAFVTEICGRRADADRQEYWALHLNRRYADTGAGSLTTTDEDQVTWTIETY